jgi:transposase
MSNGRDAVGAGGEGSVEGAVRLRVPDRAQVAMAVSSPDELIGPGHRARVVWAVVCAMDLSDFSAPIKARDGVGGRDATDPRLLVSLWLYGSIRGVGSARELARLCRESGPYRWLCGGVTVNHHLLSDFRTGHAAALDALFTRTIAALVEQGLVTVRRVSQDRVRVRASGGVELPPGLDADGTAGRRRGAREGAGFADG